MSEFGGMADELFGRLKSAPAGYWKVCKTCKAICNGKHEPMLAVGDLAEQKCPWFNHLGAPCTLAAPHGGRHFNIDAEQQFWVYGVDADGNSERWKRDWRRLRRKMGAVA